MAGINSVTIVGRLGQDPEIRRTQNGDPIANLSVATSETWRDKNTGDKHEKTEWHRITIFGGAAKIAEQYCHKGGLIGVEGKLQTRKWQDQAGNDRYSTEIIVQNFGGKLCLLGDGGGGGSNRDDRGGGRSDNRRRNDRQQEQGGGTGADIDDDIPF